MKKSNKKSNKKKHQPAKATEKRKTLNKKNKQTNLIKNNSH